MIRTQGFRPLPPQPYPLDHPEQPLGAGPPAWLTAHANAVAEKHGQCGGDAVVTHQDFGACFGWLLNLVRALVRVGKPEREILVKLHPYSNGMAYTPGIDTDVRQTLIGQFEALDPRVTAIGDFSSVRSYFPNAYRVLLGNSGAGPEATMRHKPIITFAFPEYHWATYDLRKTCDLHRAIQVDRAASDRFLYWYMEKYRFYDIQSAARRVVDLLATE